MQNIVERWNKTRLPWHYYREEKYRLSSFCTYPSTCTKCAAELASDGFVYTGSGSNNDDSVTCYFCRVTKGGWNFLDVVRDVHAAISPGCCMVTGVDCRNVPFITCSLSAQSLFNAAAGISLQEVTTGFGNTTQNNLSSLETTEAAASTSHQAQNGVLVTNSIQSSSLIGTSIPVSTNSCRLTSNTALRAVTSNNTATTVTSTHSLHTAISTQTTVTQSAQSTITQSTVIQSTLPQSTVSQPTQPFINTTASTAPNNTEHSATEIVPAITTPTNQATGAVDHAPTRRKKPGGAAPTFRDLAIITERPKRIEYALKIKRLETFENWPRSHHLTIEELASAGFYYAGYGDCARCFFCGGGLRNWEDEDDVWVEHARWFPKCAFIRQTMGQVFVDAVHTLNSEYDKISLQMVLNKIGVSSLGQYIDPKENTLKRDPAVVTVVNMGFTLDDALQKAAEIKEEGSLISADTLIDKLENDERLRIVMEHSESSETNSTNISELLEKTRIVKEQNNQLRQQTVCKICMDKEVAVVFLPCGHLSSCADCASAMRDCPICRVNVKGIVRAFMV